MPPWKALASGNLPSSRIYARCQIAHTFIPIAEFRSNRNAMVGERESNPPYLARDAITRQMLYRGGGGSALTTTTILERALTIRVGSIPTCFAPLAQVITGG